MKYSATSVSAESSDEGSSDEDEVLLPLWSMKYKMEEFVEAVNIDGEWRYFPRAVTVRRGVR